MRGGQPHHVVIPPRVGDELLHALMRGLHVRDARASARDDRSHALAITVADQPERIAREVGASLRRPEDGANAVEVITQPLLREMVDVDVHARQDHVSILVANSRGAQSHASDRNDPTSEILRARRGADSVVLVLGFVPRDWNTGAHATKPECENAEAS